MASQNQEQHQQHATVEITWEPGTDLITLTAGPMEPVAVPTSVSSDPGMCTANKKLRQTTNS